MFEHIEHEHESSWVVVMRYFHQQGRGILIKAGLCEAVAKHYASRCHCHEWIVEAMPRSQYMGA